VAAIDKVDRTLGKLNVVLPLQDGFGAGFAMAIIKSAKSNLIRTRTNLMPAAQQSVRFLSCTGKRIEESFTFIVPAIAAPFALCHERIVKY
jgi:hypothetical protein